MNQVEAQVGQNLSGVGVVLDKGGREHGRVEGVLKLQRVEVRLKAATREIDPVTIVAE